MTDVLTATIDRLSRVPGVRGALIVEADAGVPVMAELADGVAGQAVAALAGSLFRRTARAAHTADFGALRTVQLEADDGWIIAVGAGELIVVVIAERRAQLGMVRLEANKAAEGLK